MAAIASYLVAFLLLAPSLSQATTYYVSTTGSDSNNGTDLATPFRTINKCAQLIVAGDTCYVRGGTYTESGGVLLDSSGTQSAPIKLLAYPGENPIISFPAHVNTNRIVIAHASGTNVAMGWITISGFEVQGGWEGIKFHNLHNSVISNNWFHDGENSGIFGVGGHHVLFERNIFSHNGNWTQCAAGTQTCDKVHGLYAHGDSYTVRNNLFYDNIGGGIQLNGASTSLYTTARHPSPEFSGGSNWIIESNTFAHQHYASGIILWGTTTNNTRIENNIFYENRSDATSSQAIFFSGNGMSGVSIRNNHAYASGSGGTAFIGALSTSPVTDGIQYTQSGNVVNVSPPAFVNGGGSSFPASPDYRVTTSAPVNICLTNEFPNNSTCVVGAYKTVGTPAAVMTTNKITVTLPMSTAVPVQNLSTTGVSFSCTANVCPGSPAVSSISRVTGTDSQVEIVLSGITSNACLSHADAVTVSYNSSTGSWTGSDNIGPYPGSHQKILSFTNVPVTNNCTGSGPTAPSASYINYAMNDGSGTFVTDSSGNGLHGTTSGTWVSGKTGFGINVANGTTQQTTIPYGSGIDPTTQSMTWVIPVFIPTGQTGVTRYLFGPEIGANQRGYIGASSGTWRVARQSTSISAAGASNLAVVEGWNYLVARWDSTTDTVTLCNNGVTGTGGATGSYSSYTFWTNFEFPLIGSGLHTTVPEATFDDVQIFTSLEGCASLYAAWNAPPPTAGTLAQAAIQFQGAILDPAGDPIVIGASVQAIEVPAGGGAVILFQVHCTNVSDCAPTAFKLVYSKNGSSTWQQVPNIETADGTWMWGVAQEAHMNNGVRSTRLTGSCTVTPGTTQVTSSQVPSVDLPQDGCVVLGYMARVGSTQAGSYFDYKLQTEAGLDFTTYSQTARIRVVNPMASGIGF